MIGRKIARVFCALYPTSHTAGLGTLPLPSSLDEWKVYFGSLRHSLKSIGVIYQTEDRKYLIGLGSAVPAEVRPVLELMGFRIIKPERGMEDMESSYEGRQEDISNLPLPIIESWAYKFAGSGNDNRIEISTPEFTCICPKTGLPDFATLVIEYEPADRCLELKSLKEYLHAYRQVGIFHEHMVQKVLADCVKAVGPKWMTVTGKYLPRGGVYTNATASYTRPSA